MQDNFCKLILCVCVCVCVCSVATYTAFQTQQYTTPHMTGMAYLAMCSIQGLTTGQQSILKNELRLTNVSTVPARCFKVQTGRARADERHLVAIVKHTIMRTVAIAELTCVQ